MPLWDHWFKHRVEEEPFWHKVSETGHLALAQGEDPRQSQAVAHWLRLLWKQDSLQLSQLQAVLLAGRLAHSPLTAYLYTYVNRNYQPPPETPAAIHAAVVSALRSYLEQQAELLPADLPNQPVSEQGMLEAVQLTQIVQAYELQDTCADVLMAVHHKLNKLAHGADKRSIALYQQLRDTLYDTLAGFPPDKTPKLWESLKTPRGGEEFRHVIARLRDRHAVPYLLELLPEDPVPDDGDRLDLQAKVIATLRNIGDGRAVPRLQRIAAQSNSLLARPAQEALTTILARSSDDAAQLLRATDSRHADNAGETLLRTAHGSPSGSTTSPNELLRPGPAEPGPESTRL